MGYYISALVAGIVFDAASGERRAANNLPIPRRTIAGTVARRRTDSFRG
jgi:hypothetical protein